MAELSLNPQYKYCTYNRKISVRTMPRDDGLLWGAGPIGSWTLSGASGWQALYHEEQRASARDNGYQCGLEFEFLVPARADLRRTNWCFRLTGAASMRLASVLVSSPKFTARRSNKAQGEIVTKNGTESGSAGIMRNPLHLQPVPVHRTTSSSYLTYLYLYVKKKEKRLEKI